MEEMTNKKASTVHVLALNWRVIGLDVLIHVTFELRNSQVCCLFFSRCVGDRTSVDSMLEWDGVVHWFIIFERWLRERRAAGECARKHFTTWTVACEKLAIFHRVEWDELCDAIGLSLVALLMFVVHCWSSSSCNEWWLFGWQVVWNFRLQMTKEQFLLRSRLMKAKRCRRLALAFHEQGKEIGESALGDRLRKANELEVSRAAEWRKSVGKFCV